MASSKPTGVHYALVSFVLLTIVCGVFWILNHKWLNEARTETTRAKEDQKKATDALNRMLAQSGELKKLLGITLDDIGDDESNVNSVRGHIRARLNGQQGDLASTTYEDLLTKLEQAAKNASAARDDLQAKLKTEQDTFQNKMNELQAQMAEQKKARDLADQGKASSVKQYDEKQNELRAEVDDERRKRGETETAMEELQAKFDAFKKKSNQEIDNLRALNKSLTQAVQNMRRESFEVAKGQIVKVDAVTNKVWINRGSQDGLRTRTTFSVYEKSNSGVGRAAAAGAKGPEDIKGSIEITKVEEKMAEGRIVNEDLNRPIASGDPIYTPLWSPGREEFISFVGDIDIDKDGKGDFDMLNEMVQNTGAKIDNLVNQKGELYLNGRLAEGGEPKITENTKFLVKGKLPELATAKDKDEQARILRMNELLTSLEKQAFERGVRIISLSDFLSFVGYVPQKRLFVPGEPFTLRSGTRQSAVDAKNRQFTSGENSAAVNGIKRTKPQSFEGGETSKSR
ncbi:MAG TPA: hypothetical protein DDY91_02380 [Planctomycetaceae bacterium]|nr:hypothetical protein [Planctomycetaceae bacterium]